MTTKPLQHYPLGAMIPDSVHAVCCSLPTLDDVEGYEEKRPETLARVTCGYPRFILHRYVRQAMALVAERLELENRAVFLLPSRAAAEDCVRWVNTGGEALTEADFFVASFPDDKDAGTRAQTFLQHTGLCLSSRQAEDYLIAQGKLKEAQLETSSASQSESIVRSVLQSYLPTQSIHLANCGMNAFYAALRAVRDLQAPRGRHRYLQLGWLYLDTQRILEKFLGEKDALSVQLDVFDEDALRAYFAEHGSELAAIVTELPTNPLIQTPNVALLKELCEQHGVVRIFDPTIAGISSVDVLPHCDVLVTSLTKYAAHEGDVMIGALAINPASPYAAELEQTLHGKVEPPYHRDLARLAVQIEAMPAVTAK
ncbi:MAG: PLP-dependent transferase, partial [Puniceicoccales bacterium]